jgi:GNAT superfamily N-acetyltransferase
VLGRAAGDAELTRAAAANQTAWLARTAEAAGGVVHRERGLTWMASIAGGVLAFPRASRVRVEELLPRLLESAADERAQEASCWSHLPTTPRELGAILQAAGFREGWQARWMAAPIGEPLAAPPEGVVVGLVATPWQPTELPWDGAGVARVRERLAGYRPRRVWHFGAWREGRPVGHAVLNVTPGRLGVAGVHDMGVAPEERRRGIGRALTKALLAHARTLGCEVATLNATAEGELLYRQLGFRPVGVAQTWWR